MKYIKDRYYYIEYSFDKFIIYNVEEDNDTKMIGKTVNYIGIVHTIQECYSFGDYRLATNEEIRFFEEMVAGNTPYTFTLNSVYDEILY